MADTAYERRVRRLLLDEDYGPKLARLNREDTAHVLELVRINQGAQARREILRLDEERRERNTRARQQRRDNQLVHHIVHELRNDGVYRYSIQMIAFGVNLMTRSQHDTTFLMDGPEIRARAGDPDFIEYILPLDIEHNKWWYH